jgi:hypothetical protein
LDRAEIDAGLEPSSGPNVNQSWKQVMARVNGRALSAQ